MIDFSTLKGLTVPEGVVVKIESGGRVLWEMPSGGRVVLETVKITSDTYAGETTYTGESFILLDIYPKTNGTVSVTYGGLTKTITDTTGVAEPNAQQVFFGTLYGVSDEVETPASGRLTISGDYVAFACGEYAYSSKNNYNCACVKKILDFGMADHIPDDAFYETTLASGVSNMLTGEVVIPSTVKTIGDRAFGGCLGISDVTIGDGVVSVGIGAFSMLDVEGNKAQLKSITMLPKIPPALGFSTANDGTKNYGNFSVMDATGDEIVYRNPTIVVPKGCGEAYKTAEGWNEYADHIMEAS